MKNSRLKRGVLASLSLALVIGSAIAFMTDNKLNRVGGKFGDLSISTKLSTEDILDNLAPGDSLSLDLEVENTGSLDGLIRTTYSVVVPEEDIASYKLGDLSLYVDGDLVLDVVNTPHIYKDITLDALGVQTHSLELQLDSKLLNDIQGLNFRVEVLTEIKQGDTGWEELLTDVIRFGSIEDYKTVPSYMALRSTDLTVNRVLVDGLDTQGYIVSNLMKLDTPTVGDFKKLFYNETKDIHLFDVENVAAMGDDELIKTGNRVKLIVEDVVMDDLTVVQIGDLDDDGIITGSDRMALHGFIRDLESTDTEVLSKYSVLDYLVGDIDGDGYITRNDDFIMYDVITGRVDQEALNHFPQKPNLKFKPSMGITFTDNEVLSRPNYVYGVGNKLSNGAEVGVGDIFELRVDVNTLQKLKVYGLGLNVLFDSEHVELLDTEGRDGVIFTGGVLRNNSFFPTYLDDVDSDIRHTDWVNFTPKRFVDGVVPLHTYTQNKVEYDASVGKDINLNLNDSGTFAVLKFKVKDSVPSGTRLNFSLDDINFTYAGYGDLTFNDILSSSGSGYLVVK